MAVTHVSCFTINSSVPYHDKRKRAGKTLGALINDEWRETSK